MTPIRMPHTTRTLGAPKNWDEGKNGPCVGLPITDVDGVMLSYWKPTWTQRLLVLAGRPVRMAIWGSAHPPVWVDTQP
jgi:hypothetical protein